LYAAGSGTPIPPRYIRLSSSLTYDHDRTRDNSRATTVHFERAGSAHHHDRIGLQSRVATLDVEELFHADVRAKAGFRHHKPVFTDKLPSKSQSHAERER
jgi:hypothetical protein